MATEKKFPFVLFGNDKYRFVAVEGKLARGSGWHADHVCFGDPLWTKKDGNVQLCIMAVAERSQTDSLGGVSWVKCNTVEASHALVEHMFVDSLKGSSSVKATK